ncbi:MAG: phosphoglycerate kinase [Deltaproteobacteria bacterium]|nr:phosphoglycerate kinase [Deltaproteobacteria bacterium]MBW2052161.1 phosphoglycerate kinase [Deltaproteobacteria bacterium]MBW2139669.1 phosphoglycerate kinase [Deltaproteobacteria bacterium]MBW2322281.1 phosphoglycerate kinase [Deltaproteobacteria bacterium]
MAPPEERLKFINELDLKGKTVLIRVDLNVPLDEHLNITDDSRIRTILPTVNYALDEGARIILISHMGRPKGKAVPELSLAPVARRLRRLLKKEVVLAPDCVGEEVEKLVSDMKSGDIILLENLRFHSGEEQNDDEFAKQLARLADVYINDAFAVAHRPHASVVAITKFFSKCAAGFLMKNELTYFYRAMEDPARPFVAIIGGAKISSKISAIENLMERVDKLIIGGAMANTFLKAIYPDIGTKSLLEEDLVEKARSIMRKARQKGIKFYIPVDCVVTDRFDVKAETKMTTVQEVPEDWMIVDIGPATSYLFTEALQDAKTIIWNGPMGAFEIDAFSRGTFQMVHSVANSYSLTIVGGGDTDVAVNKVGESSRMTYISTGGGAFLQLLEGSRLPGIVALEDHASRDNQTEES